MSQIHRVKPPLKKEPMPSDILEGTVLSRTPTGYSVSAGEFIAVCPVSQIDRFPGRDLDSFIGRTLRFMVESTEDGQVTLSRRALQEQAANLNREQIWDTIKVGDRLEGVVTSIRPYGVFVDLEGVEGLIHKTELAWDRVDDPSQVLQRWDRVQVIISEVDKKRRRIALSLRDPDTGPWSRLGKDFKVGGIYEGRVQKTTNFGAFVELFPGMVGLVRMPNLSWDHVRKTSEVVRKGDQIKVKILSADPSRQRLDLGIRQITPDPADVLAETYTVGQKVTGVVQRSSKSGLQLLVDDNVEAWLPARQVRLPPGVMLEQRYRRGFRLEAQVVEVDRRRRQLKVSQMGGPETEEHEALRHFQKTQGQSTNSFGTLGDLMGKIKVER